MRPIPGQCRAGTALRTARHVSQLETDRRCPSEQCIPAYRAPAGAGDPNIDRRRWAHRRALCQSERSRRQGEPGAVALRVDVRELMSGDALKRLRATFALVGGITVAAALMY